MTRGGPPAWGLGVGLTTLHRKKNKFVMTISIDPWTWTDCLLIWYMVLTCQFDSEYFHIIYMKPVDGSTVICGCSSFEGHLQSPTKIVTTGNSVYRAVA
jgi:hypothetical protein